MGIRAGAALGLGLSLAAAFPAPSLTLEEAVALARSRNERTEAARAETRAAEARVGQARSFLLPDLTATGDYARRSQRTERTVDGETSTLQELDGLEARLTVEQTLIDARAWPLLALARRSRDAARADEQEAGRLLAHQTAGAFLAALHAEQVARAAAERLDLAKRNLDEVRVRFDAQLVGSNDVTRADLEAASAERELVRARGTARTARLDLGWLLASDIRDSLAVPDGLLADAARPPAGAGTGLAEAAARRPDLRAARARVAALRASAQEPLMRYLPDVGFTGTTWTTNESGFSGRDRDWTLGLGLTWELFDGGEREAVRAERSALARAAELDLAGLERSVATDVETARVALESEQASLARAEVAVGAARRNAGETAELYRQGLVRALEVVDANVQLFEAEVERAGAQVALARAFLDYRAAFGLHPLGTGDLP
jgi:outer membrane protein TolC